MKMRFYKKNAYPEIFLHDCQFKPEYINNSLFLRFENGFCRQGVGNIEKLKGYIKIADIPLEEVTIKAYKRKSRFGKYKEIVSCIEFADLSRLLEDYDLEVIDEYYCRGQVLYKCTFYPYRHKPYDSVEIAISYGGGALEYYVDDESDNDFGA